MSMHKLKIPMLRLKMSMLRVDTHAAGAAQAEYEKACFQA
jgi:hypothetical protein